MIKQVILVRLRYPDGKGGTFKPRFGKLAAQIAHASMKVFLDRGHVALETDSGFIDEPEPILVVPLTPEMESWVEGIFTKIVLSVETAEDLLRAYQLAQEAGLPCSLVMDVGNTEFHGVPTHTTVAIGPAVAEEIDKITGPNGLVKTSLA